MPRVYKRKRPAQFQAEDVRRALSLIDQGETVQRAAQATGISWHTLMRYKKTKTASCGARCYL